MKCAASETSATRKLFFWFRITVLLSISAGVLLLALWNRQTDPRFYVFLSTPPGIILSRVMNWPNLNDKAEREGVQQDLSTEEVRALQKLLSESDIFQPTHQLTLTNGRTLQAQLLKENEENLVVRHQTDSRSPEQRIIPRITLERMGPFMPDDPEVTRRDVRFQMAFPDLRFSHSEHYTVLSDAPQNEVEAIKDALEDLRSQYLDIFGSLARYPKPDVSLQVLFFTHESDYRAHQESTAPHLNDSTGYYSPLEDRMVLYNDQFSERTENAQQHVQEEIAFLQDQITSLKKQDELRDFEKRLNRYIQNRAIKNTLFTLRHEGAHHLSYTYGVHSWIHAENAWLIEGMAAYFESPEPGQPLSSYQFSLRNVMRENRMPSLFRLMEVRLPEHFGHDLPNLRPYEAYALSRSLFIFCMQPRHRDAFFTFLRDIQAPGNISDLLDTPRHERLSRTLSLSPGDLESKWRAWLRHYVFL